MKKSFFLYLFLVFCACSQVVLAEDVPLPVTCDFQEMSLNAFVAFVSQQTGGRYVVSDDVETLVDVSCQAGLNVDGLPYVLDAVLLANGLIALEDDGITRIVAQDFARRSGSTYINEADNNIYDQADFVTRVLRVENIRAGDVVDKLAALGYDNDSLLAPTDQVIVVADRAGNVQRLSNIIAAVDRYESQGGVRIFRPMYQDAKSIKEVIQGLLDGPDRKGSIGVLGEPLVFCLDGANLLGAVGSAYDLERVSELVKGLDVPSRMVEVECQVVEIVSQDGNEIGADLQAIFDDIGFVFGGTDASFSGGADGVFTGGILAEDFRAIIRLARESKNVDLRAATKLLTFENQESLLSVGRNVPYKTGSGTSNAGVDYEDIEYKDVGLTLKIKPSVRDGKKVFLHYDYESTELETEIGVVTPTTRKRSFRGYALLSDGESLAIGGVKNIGQSLERKGVPGLMNLPWVGKIFSNDKKTYQKTDVWVILTPRII